MRFRLVLATGVVGVSRGPSAPRSRPRRPRRPRRPVRDGALPHRADPDEPGSRSRRPHPRLPGLARGGRRDGHREPPRRDAEDDLRRRRLPRRPRGRLPVPRRGGAPRRNAPDHRPRRRRRDPLGRRPDDEPDLRAPPGRALPASPTSRSLRRPPSPAGPSSTASGPPASERSNLAVFNPGTSPVDRPDRRRERHGRRPRRSSSPTPSRLEPGEWRQVDGILAEAGLAQGWAVVERTEGGVFGAYGVVNDGGTNDGSYLEAVRRRGDGRDRHGPGARRDAGLPDGARPREPGVELRRPRARLPRVALAALGAGGTRDRRRSPRASSGSSRRRSRSCAASASRSDPPGAASYAGRLRVSGGSAGAGGLYAAARVSSLSPGGRRLRRLPPGRRRRATSSRTEGVVTGLRADADVRSNVAVRPRRRRRAPGQSRSSCSSSTARRGGIAGGLPDDGPPRRGVLAPALRPAPAPRGQERLGARPEDGRQRTRGSPTAS